MEQSPFTLSWTYLSFNNWFCFRSHLVCPETWRLQSSGMAQLLIRHLLQLFLIQMENLP